MECPSNLFPVREKSWWTLLWRSWIHETGLNRWTSCISPVIVHTDSISDAKMRNYPTFVSKVVEHSLLSLKIGKSQSWRQLRKRSDSISLKSNFVPSWASTATLASFPLALIRSISPSCWKNFFSFIPVHTFMVFSCWCSYFFGPKTWWTGPGRFRFNIGKTCSTGCGGPSNCHWSAWLKQR